MGISIVGRADASERKRRDAPKKQKPPQARDAACSGLCRTALHDGHYLREDAVEQIDKESFDGSKAIPG